MSNPVVRATRIGPLAHHYVHGGFRTGVVVARFGRGFAALLDESFDPGFVTFQHPGYPLHPWAVELESTILPQLDADCYVDKGIVYLVSGFFIDLSNATLTNLRILPWSELSANSALQHVPDLKAAIEEACKMKSHVALLQEMGLHIPEELAELLVKQIGRGPGSTPSGDDYVVGQLAVQWALHEVSEEARRQLTGFQRLCHWDHLKERTPIGSAQMILAAAAGQFPEPVGSVMQTLTMDLDGGFHWPAVKALSQQGVTSGTATLAGILDGLTYLGTY